MTTTLERKDDEPDTAVVTQPVQGTRRRAGAGHPSTLRWWVLAVLGVQVLIAFDADLPFVRPLLALAGLLGLPALMLYRKAALPGGHITKAIYAFGCSLLGLLLVALLLNTTLPYAGVQRPLQPLVLATTWLGIDVALLLWRARTTPLPSLTSIASGVLDARLELSQALGTASLVLAVLGAVRLNNGAGGHVALLAHGTAAAALLTLLLRREGAPGRDARTLALVAASLLLATSLRGWGITGHDIQAEYFAFKLTNADQHWSMAALQNAYNACLSVNVLPTVLAQTTGLTGVVVFKVLLQLVFALVPVLTFLLSRRFLPRRLALAAAAFTLAFPTFFTDMPYLVRQEVAFFFLGLLLLAATEPGVPAGRRRLLVGVFGVGVVLSHYSTTYLMLLGLLIGLVALGAWRVLAHRFASPGHGTQQPLVLLSPVIVLFLALTSIAWAGPATHTGGHAEDVARATIAALLGDTGDTPGSSDVTYRLFSRDRVSPRERLDLFVDETLEARKLARDGELLVRHPGPAELRPEIVPAATVPLTGAGRALDSSGLDPSALSTVARLACAALLQILLLLGAVAMLSRTRASSRASDSEVSRETACVVIGSGAALGLVVLVPQLSVEYGVLRAFLQTVLVAAPVMAAGLWMLARPLRAGASAVTVAVPVAALLILSGTVPSLLGGNPARLALQNSGLYYDRYIAADSDVRTMTWLADAWDDGSPEPKVIASRNYGIRIASTGDSPTEVADRMYPTMLTRGSYVFVDSHLERTRQSTIFYSGDLITYEYPLHVLGRRLDLVYSSGHSRVYR